MSKLVDQFPLVQKKANNKEMNNRLMPDKTTYQPRHIQQIHYSLPQTDRQKVSPKSKRQKNLR
jgi:hypothetical protein